MYTTELGTWLFIYRTNILVTCIKPHFWYYTVLIIVLTLAVTYKETFIPTY